MLGYTRAYQSFAECNRVHQVYPGIAGLYPGPGHKKGPEMAYLAGSGEGVDIVDFRADFHPFHPPFGANFDSVHAGRPSRRMTVRWV